MDIIRTIADFWPLAIAVATVLVGYILWRLNSHFAPRKEFEEEKAIRAVHHERISELEAGHMTLKARVENLPGEKALHRMEIKLEEMNGLYREVSAQIKGQDAALVRMNNTLERLVESRLGASK